MKFPILTSVLILCLVIAFFNRRGREQIAAQENEFWDKELAANNTRRKPLDNLNYISIPLEKLPIEKYQDNNSIKEYTDTIVELAKSQIVNLTGISNTDLKLTYGAPNLDVLAAYDSRYTKLASTLQKWASALYELGDITSAISVLEYAVSTKTDISKTYKLLGDLYLQINQPERIKGLLSQVQEINSPLVPSTVQYLTDLIGS